MFYVFDYGYHANMKFFAVTQDSNYLKSGEQYAKLDKFEDECIEWLNNNLCINYTYKLHYDSKSLWLSAISFRHEEDMLMFRLRFGL